MKKSTRRIFSLITVLALLLSLTTLLSGCYVVRSGKMKQIQGTYQLTSYSGLKDHIAERNRVLYIVIRSDGTGYYAYKDDYSEPHIAELRCRYIHDEEDSGKYSYVELNFDGGTGYEKFAISASLDHTSLNSSTFRWKNTSNLSEGTYTLNVGFTRVDTATDLSYINESFGAYEPLPHGSLRFSHSYALQEIEDSRTDAEPFESPFVYSYMKIDVAALKLKAWYMLKSDEIAHAEEHTLEIVRDGFGGYYLKADEVDIIPDSTQAPYGYYFRVKAQESVFYKYSVTGDLTDDYAAQLAEADYSAYLSQKTHDMIEDGIRGLMKFECKTAHGDGVECDCEQTPNVANPDKYTPEEFARIDALIAEYFVKYKASESYLDCDLLAVYKSARLYYLYESAIATVEAAYESSAHPMKDDFKEQLITKINAAYGKKYTFSATVDCTVEHGEGVECDCESYTLVEDVASEALKAFTKEYCEGIFAYAE